MSSFKILAMAALEVDLLAYLWRLNATHGTCIVNWRDWAVENGYEPSAADHAFDVLNEQGLVEAGALGPHLQLTVRGQMHVEDNQFVTSDEVAEHYRFRTDFLLALADLRDAHSLNHAFDFRAVLQDIGASQTMFAANEQFLESCGYIESVAIGTYRITARGYSSVLELRAKRALLAELDHLQSGGGPTPQKRGHELERLLEAAAAKEGWRTERNALAAGEENDLILSRDLNYFIVSCKWEAAPIGTDAIRNLRDRITHRPTSRGILVSMSGFAQTTVDNAGGRLESAVILLFGPGDVRSSLAGKFTPLLTEKLHEAMVHRKFPYT